jgi:hypothetical protein
MQVNFKISKIKTKICHYLFIAICFGRLGHFRVSNAKNVQNPRKVNCKIKFYTRSDI